jgi:hypothetical protein
MLVKGEVLPTMGAQVLNFLVTNDFSFSIPKGVVFVNHLAPPQRPFFALWGRFKAEQR